MVGIVVIIPSISNFSIKTRHIHEVTVAALCALQDTAYDNYSTNPPSLIIGHHIEIGVNYSNICQISEGVKFKLYIEAIDQLIPWFFALDHMNYARWLPVYIRDMKELAIKHPLVDNQFQGGNFTAKNKYDSLL